VSWPALASVPPGTLTEATLQLHWAVQLVAAAGRTFAEPASDDSHTSMSWSESLDAFVGVPFAGPYPFRVALRPADLTLLLLDRTGASVATLPLTGQRLEEAYEWLGVGVATYFGGPPPVLERAAYEIPEHAVGRGAPFPAGSDDALGSLAALYGSAADAIDEATDAIEGASEVRCWPHHFDIASLITLARDADGTPTRTVGVGMSPMGGGYDRWYWYVSPWPAPVPAELPPLRLGSWHTEGWTGAVLEGEAVVALPEGERAKAVSGFLTEAIDAAFEAHHAGGEG
jgi:hypothetical protein